MIDGFSVCGFRSFASEVRVSDLSKLNIFIGKNNCGKSNILRFVKLISAVESGRAIDPAVDRCIVKPCEITAGIQIKRGGHARSTYDALATRFAQAQISLPERLGSDLWFGFLVERQEPAPSSVTEWTETIRSRFNEHETNRLTGQLCGYTEGSPQRRCSDIAKRLHAEVRLEFPAHLISAFRRISDARDDPLSGAGLISELRKLQSPRFDKYEESSAKFARITEFLRSVTGEPGAELRVPAEQDDVYVIFDGKHLPLESLGTGIHQVVILAAAVSMLDHSLICIEEPELHCHPELQKKLARYVLDHTDNQYLIATHSNAFIDIPEANIYTCSMESNVSVCQLASRACERHAALFEMGYRPSDILQANYLIWVEGPSDRIYINHWIAKTDPALREGLHYQIVFYGGRLLAHVCFEEEAEHAEMNDFIQLATLNRRACIVLDSDKGRSSDPVNSTKERVMAEFRAKGCKAWLTGGRTIENYLPSALLNEVIMRVHPKVGKPIAAGPFADVTKTGRRKAIDKVTVARHITKAPADLSVLDLRARIDELTDDIRRANHLG